jgi:N-acetylglucosamine-6-phosphate deacetylase
MDIKSSLCNRLLVHNALLVMPDKIIDNGFVYCENGIIVHIGQGSYTPEGETTVINAQGLWLSPGFIDIHTHGAGGHDFLDNTVESYLGIAEIHAKHGTTSLSPTTITTPLHDILRTFEVYREAKKMNIRGANFIGLHLEGPYLSFNYRGAQDPRYLRNPIPEEYNAILEASNDIVRWTISPELEGALRLGRLLRDRGILASIGHTEATYDQTFEAFDNGFTHVTHMYSCMSTVTRRNGYRHAGALEAAYMINDMSVEIIADGIHLPQSLLQFVCRFKSLDRIALCTDSMRAAGLSDGIYMLGFPGNGLASIVEDGVAKLPDRSALAGSIATADRLVRTMMQLAGLPLVDAIRMITLNPARILGIDNRKGILKPGADADFTVFGKDISVEATICNGRIIYQAGE